jgi:hypothetical protein
MSCGRVEKVSWRKISGRVEETSQSFAMAMNSMPHHAKGPSSQENDLFLVSYFYGDLVVRDGVFQSPCRECSKCKELSKIVGNSIPLSLVLNNSVEVFLEQPTEHRTIPLRILNKGELFGVFEILYELLGIERPSLPPWSVSAGARSVVILAPFGDRRVKESLKQLMGISHQGLADHLCKGRTSDYWQLLRMLARGATPDWSTQVVILPNAWVKKRVTPDLLKYIAKTGWEQSENLRNQPVEEFDIRRGWHGQVMDVRYPELMYVYATLRHLIAIGKGELPAFKRTQSDEAGPFIRLEEKMRGATKIVGYSPSVLVPSHLKTAADEGLYSIRIPTVLYPWLVPRNLLNFLDYLNKATRSVQGSLPATLSEVGFYSNDSRRESTTHKDTKDAIELSNVLHRQERSAQSVNGGEPEEAEVNGADLRVYTGSPFFKACVRIVRK